MLIRTGPVARSPSARCGPRGSDVSLRLRGPTMTPAIVPFNRSRKYQVHPGTAQAARASSAVLVFGAMTSDVDRLAGIPSPTDEETPAGAGWIALDYGRNLGAEGGRWPGVGRAAAEMSSGRVGSTKGRVRIFAGLCASQPSGHATVGQGAERRPMARSMAPPPSGNRRVSGLTKSGSLGRAYSRRKPGMRGRSYPFRWPGSGPWRFAPPLCPARWEARRATARRCSRSARRHSDG